ncbi:oocyte zinc finger protein XlCOF6-like [Corythoichthys intestinalis]|uniref:oocyte zinc finger protein XlCOF6-like n=1 Tax=Corythoichthys intestinalis TaxID=161448 RepID=UPI0025A5503D|nr:oocyte zinc finger protein XlCOF6-like [Corythoichthys intestinalis]
MTRERPSCVKTTRMSVLGEEDAAAVKKVDAGIKCSWNWAWLKLEGKVSVKGQEVYFHVSDFFKKIDRQGLARCVLCHKHINYTKKGSHALIAHVQTEIHKKKMEDIVSTQSVASILPASASQSQPAQGPETVRHQFQEKMPVPVVSRIANAEAMVLGTLAEHSIPFSMAPVIVELAQTLSLDKPALQGMKLSQTAGSYKMIHGLDYAGNVTEKTFSNMRFSFSSNIDECTSNNNKKCPADVTEEELHPEKHNPLHIKQEEESEMPYIKQEAEPDTPYIKEEEQEDEIPKFPVTISVKSEVDEGPSENSGAAKPLSDCSFQQLTTKEEGRTQLDGLFAPLSDTDDVTSHSSDFKTDEEDVDFDQNALKSLNRSSLKSDSKECAVGKPFACTLCGKRYSHKYLLKVHKRTHTGEKPFVCTCCGKRFNEMRKLKRHARTHTGEKPFVCSLCDKRFSRKISLERHMRTHTGEKPFVCTCCGKKFTEKRNLNQHISTHTGEKRFACSLCEKSFFFQSQLTRHTHTHTGEKPFACTICDKRFTEKGNLNQHISTHTGEKRFACSLCEKSFFCQSQLTRHTHTHTGKKPFACTCCGKRFANNGHLNQHASTHTGEKRFVCTICDKRFSQKSDLTIHTRSHTGEKPFVCSVCHKRFCGKGTLNRHARTHTGEKPFGCSLCGKRFTQKGHLVLHRKKHCGKTFEIKPIPLVNSQICA